MVQPALACQRPLILPQCVSRRALTCPRQSSILRQPLFMQKRRNSATILPFSLASIALMPKTPGQDGANVGRCFSLRLIIPVLIASRCFGFIQGRESETDAYIDAGRTMMLLFRRTGFFPILHRTVVISTPRLLTACLSFLYSL